MRIRSTQIFPVSSTGQIALPKRPRSWRVVSIAVSSTMSATVANRQIILRVFDGASNLLGDYNGALLLAAGYVLITTFASNVSSLSGFLSNEMIAIPDDLWMQPNWTAVVQISNAQAGDILSAQAVIEYFEPSRKGGRDEGTVEE